MTSTPQKASAWLSSRWVFWRDKWETTKEGEAMQSLLDLGEADTVRSFWHLFESNSVNLLPENCCLQVFKKHVKPEWEDPSNIDGGHFRLIPLPGNTTNPANLWSAIMTGAIGDQFTLSSSICGVGYANKGARKVISVWVNTSDPSAVRTLQTELCNLTQDKYSSKFVAHRELSRTGFTAQQSCWHRRTKSAPSPFVTIDFDDEDEGQAAYDSKQKKRAIPLPLDSHFLHSGDSHSAVDASEHSRSKSEGLMRDVVPSLHQLGIAHQPRVRQSPPPSAERADAEFSWSDPSATELRESNSGVYPTAKAPTPMKEWADNWSPSLLNAALQHRAPFALAPGASIEPITITPPNQARSPAHGQAAASGKLDVNAPPFKSSSTEVSPMNLSQTVGTTITLPIPPTFIAQSNPFATGPPTFLQPTYTPATQFFHPPPTQLSPGAYPISQPHPYVIVRQTAHPAPKLDVMPTPMFARTSTRATANPALVPSRDHKPPMPQPPIAPPRKESPAPQPVPSLNGSDSRRAQHTKSDSAPFIFNGWKYPGGLNRKERRRIMFGEDVVPSEYPGAVFVGAEAANGPCDEE